MLIGTAGHIDHGKTSLVRALTGVDTDRLKEEKARGMSIELGFAYRAVAGAGVLGFIDVPGHEKFIHHMLAGASGIDFALLVIAADDGVMPQTLEHLDILGLLGIGRGAVVLTKVDRCDAVRVQEARREAESLVAATKLHGAPLFEVSTVTGAGIDALQAHLAAEAAVCERRAPGGLFRLAIDRCFTLHGAGTVATGTVFAGRVRVGDELVVSPSGHKVRVRGIHAQNAAAEEGRAGDRCALNLAGVSKEEVRRGEWIVSPGLHAPTQRLDARVRLLPGASRPLKHWVPVQVHLGAAHLPARIALLDPQELVPGGTALAQIVLDVPHSACHGDLFVIRDHGAAQTIGGGVVLDPDGPPRRRRSPERLAALAALQLPTASAALGELLEECANGIDLVRFCRAYNLDAASLPEPAGGLRRVRAGEEDFAFAPAGWAALKTRVTEELGAFHARHPDELGPDASRARRMWMPRLPIAACGVLLDEMAAEKSLLRNGPWLHLPGHRVSFSAAETSMAERLVPLVEAGGFDPLWVRDLSRRIAAGESQVRSLMNRLARRGDLFQVVKDLFYSKRSIAELAAIAAELERDAGEVRAADFRDRTGLGRKRAIQVLEFFDRIGYTRRVREAHRLRTGNLFMRKEVVPGGAAGLQTQ